MNLPHLPHLPPPQALFPTTTLSSSTTSLSPRAPTLRLHVTASDFSLIPTTADDVTVLNSDQKLLTLLQQRKTDEAWTLHPTPPPPQPHLPQPPPLPALLPQLTRLPLTRQVHIHAPPQRAPAPPPRRQLPRPPRRRRLQVRPDSLRRLHRPASFPTSRPGPPSSAASPDDRPADALKLFYCVTRRVRHFSEPEWVSESKPDTAAFNAALNACANLGDSDRFLKLFEEMSIEWGAEPDVLTYNVMIKLCVRVGKKDLLVFVLERILEKEIEVCMTTLNSLVAAYVGFGDLETAEKMVQAMREGRRDLCMIFKGGEFEEWEFEWERHGGF